MSWQSAIEFLGGATVFGAVFAYLGKVSIDAYLSGRIEEYKSELGRLNTEHSVRFNKLHAERAECVKELYEHIIKLDDTLASTLAAFQHVTDTPLTKRVESLADRFNETRYFYRPRRIFFDSGTCELLDGVLAEAQGIFFGITVMQVDPTHEHYKFDRDLLKDRHEFWEKARNAHKSKFQPLKEKLENQFRDLLGIGT